MYIKVMGCYFVIELSPSFKLTVSLTSCGWFLVMVSRRGPLAMRMEHVDKKKCDNGKILSSNLWSDDDTVDH